MLVVEFVIMVEELVIIELEFVLAMLSVLLIELEELGVVISEELLVVMGVEVELCTEVVGDEVELVLDFEDPRARYAPTPITTMITTTTTIMAVAAIP
jgi:hypothetical protein